MDNKITVASHVGPIPTQTGGLSPTKKTQEQRQRDYCTRTFDPVDIDRLKQERLTQKRKATQSKIAAGICTVTGFKNLPKFYDVGPLLRDPTLLWQAMKIAAEDAQALGPTHVAGVDARGFVFGPLIAQLLDLPFVMIRKKGKMPNEEAVSNAYAKEYAAHDGLEQLAMQEGAVKKGDRVVIVDDVCATGSTLVSCEQVVAQLGAEVVCHSCLIHMKDLGAQERLKARVFHVVPETMLSQ